MDVGRKKSSSQVLDNDERSYLNRCFAAALTRAPADVLRLRRGFGGGSETFKTRAVPLGFAAALLLAGSGDRTGLRPAFL
jgi:hypothetical protein